MNIAFQCAVEDRGCNLPAECFCNQTEVNFQHLTDVHTGRHAQRVENYLKRSSVFHERHIFLREYSGHDALVSVAACHFIADAYLSLLRDIYADELVYAGGHFVFVCASEHFYVHYDAAFAVRNTQRRIAYFACFFAEYCAEQSFFGSKFGFALRSNLTYQNISGLDFGTDTNDTVFVEVFERVVADVGNITGDFLFAKLSVARFVFVFFDMNRGESVVFYYFFADKNSIFVVITFPAHETDKDVSSESKLCILGAGTVGNNLSGRDFIALGNCGFLIYAGTLVGSYEFL